jgi:O-antigen ligase
MTGEQQSVHTGLAPAIFIALLLGAGFGFSLFIGSLIIASLIILPTCIWLILKKPLWAALFLIAVLPLERIGAMDVGGFTLRLSQILLLALTIRWTISVVATARWRQISTPPSPLLLPITIFLSSGIISLLATPHPQRSLTVLGFTGFTTLIAFVLPRMLTEADHMRRATVVLLGSALAVSVFGLWQFAGDSIGLPTAVTGLRPLYTKQILGFPRVQSTAYEPLYFASYLLLPLLTSLALLLTGKKNKEVPAKLLWALVITGGIAFVLTVARGGYGALAAGLGILGCFYLRSLLRPQTIGLLLGGVVIIGMTAFITLANTGDPFTSNLEKFNRHVTNIFSGASFEERSHTLDEALRLFRLRPVLGHGIGSFGPHLAPTTMYPGQHGWAIVNNHYIELLAEQGIVGLLSWLSIIGVLVIRSIKALRADSDDTLLRNLLIGGLAALAGVLVQYLTFSTLYIMHIWFLFGWLLAIQNLLLKKK